MGVSIATGLLEVEWEVHIVIIVTVKSRQHIISFITILLVLLIVLDIEEVSDDVNE